MAVNSKEQAFSLLAAANNHGDLAVKLSSLRQVKDLLLSSLHPRFASELFPFLVELQSSHESLLRKLLLQVIEEIGLRVLEHCYVLVPVLLTLLKDEDPGVAQQSIVSGMKFFHSILEELARQPVSVGTRLLALKFLETCVLLFTPDAADSDKLIFED